MLVLEFRPIWAVPAAKPLTEHHV